ncbi:MAG TPA: hypothetical protein PK925_16850, partial [Alicycliphilus sp.]|nr:hypothetical protein [Alicycliphilus sp.]
RARRERLEREEQQALAAPASAGAVPGIDQSGAQTSTAAGPSDAKHAAIAAALARARARLAADRLQAASDL